MVERQFIMLNIDQRQERAHTGFSTKCPIIIVADVYCNCAIFVSGVPDFRPLEGEGG